MESGRASLELGSNFLFFGTSRNERSEFLSPPQVRLIPNAYMPDSWRIDPVASGTDGRALLTNREISRVLRVTY